MNWAYQLTTPPTIEPIEVGLAIEHMRLPDSTETAKVLEAIRGARSDCEQYMRRGLLTQTWTYAQDDWTDEIQLPMAAPLQSVTSVKYYNVSGTLTTLATTVYQVDVLSEPGRIYLKPNQSWPSLESGRRMAVEIVYVVGWTEPSLIPPSIIDGIYLRMADTFEHREGTLVGSVQTVATELPTSAHAKWGDRVSWVEPRCAA